MDTQISGEDIDGAIAELAAQSGRSYSEVHQFCLTRAGDQSVDGWASAVARVAAELLPATPHMVDEYVAAVTPEEYHAREARAAQVQLSDPEEYGITPDGRLLTPDEVNSEILRLRGAYGDRSGIDPIKASAAVSFAPPVQLSQTGRSKYRDEDAGFEDTLSLSATHDSTQTDEDKVLALTSRYTAYFGDGSPGAPRSAFKIGAKGDQPSTYRATVDQRQGRHPQGSAEEVIARAMQSRATRQMFGLTQLPSYEHDVTDEDFTPDDATDSASVADKINAVVNGHPDLFGVERPRSANFVTRPLSPQQREAAEVRALAGGRPGGASIPDLASGRFGTASR
jgi:hypothetical protein